MKRLWLLLSCMPFCLGFAEAASVNPVAAVTLAIDQPMQVKRVRSNEANCEPNCPEWISAEGKILAGTAAEFRQVINSLGSRKLPVFIHSGGGAVRDAMAIGRLIRDRQLDVAVARTEFDGCDAVGGCPQSDGVRGKVVDFHAICASACTLVLAGGEHRFVAPFAFVGVHQIIAFQTRRTIYRTYRVLTRRLSPTNVTVARTLVSEKEISKTYQLPRPPKGVEDDMSRYLSDMGVAEGIRDLMAATPASSIHWMTVAELDATHVATDFRAAAALLGKPMLLPAVSVDAGRDGARKAALGASGTILLGKLHPDGAMAVESFHQTGEPAVSVRLRDDLASAGQAPRDLVASIDLGNDQVFKTVGLEQSPPIVAIIPVAAICSLGQTGFVKVGFQHQ
jgi:hypothetical protein